MVVFCVCFLVPDDDDDDDDDGSGGSSSTPKAKYVSSLVTSLCTRVAQLGPRLVMPLLCVQHTAVSSQHTAVSTASHCECEGDACLFQKK